MTDAIFPPTTAAELLAYEPADVLAGRASFLNAEGRPGPSRPPGFRWGWQTAYRDRSGRDDGYDHLRFAVADRIADTLDLAVVAARDGDSVRRMILDDVRRRGAALAFEVIHATVAAIGKPEAECINDVLDAIRTLVEAGSVGCNTVDETEGTITIGAETMLNAPSVLR